MRDCGYKRVIFELFCQFLTVRMWLPRGKIGFSEVARRSGAFSVSRPLNALTGHQSTARTSAGSLRGYRRIGRSLLEYVPDTRREHGDGRFHRGGGRRAVSGARRDFPTTEETCRRPRACPNRSALRIRDGYRTARVDVDTRALLRERHARPIRPTRRRIGHGRAARRAFSVRVGDFVACCSRAFTVEAAENCAVPDASRGDGPDRLSRRTMVRGVSREPWDPPHRPRVRLTSVPFHRRRIFHSGHRVPRRGSSQHDARAFHLPDSRRETSLARRPRVKLTARTVRYHRRKTFDDKLNAIGVILTVRRPGPHPTRPSSTKFTSPAETHTTRKTKLSPHDHSDDPSHPHTDARVGAHVRARHRVVLARVPNRHRTRTRVRHRQLTPLDRDGGSIRGETIRLRSRLPLETARTDTQTRAMPRRFSSSTPYHWRWLHCTACRCAGSFTSRIPALPWRSSRLGRRRSPTGSRGSRLRRPRSTPSRAPSPSRKLPRCASRRRFGVSVVFGPYLPTPTRLNGFCTGARACGIAES